VRSAEAQRLLVDIHDATRGLQDPSVVTGDRDPHRHALRRHSGSLRRGHTEQDQVVMTRGYTKGVPTVAGRYPLDLFGPLMVGELKAGRTAIINDVRSEPLTDTPTAQATYARMQIVSLVCVPLLRGGKLAATLVMCDGRANGRGPGPPARTGGRADAVCSGRRAGKRGAA
jgi:GAF domain-containing protein